MYFLQVSIFWKFFFSMATRIAGQAIEPRLPKTGTFQDVLDFYVSKCGWNLQGIPVESNILFWNTSDFMFEPEQQLIALTQRDDEPADDEYFDLCKQLKRVVCVRMNKHYGYLMVPRTESNPKGFIVRVR